MRRALIPLLAVVALSLGDDAPAASRGTQSSARNGLVSWALDLVPAGAAFVRGIVSADPVDAGRALFYAKGCATCHHKSDVNGTGPGIGPDLTELRDRAGSRRPGYTAEAYVRESLRAPTAFIVPGFGSSTLQMPDVHLADGEIDALTAFLLAPER